MVETACKNHPTKKANRRCFLCKQFVCADCQILASHHYFCGIACYNKFVLSTRPGGASKPEGTPKGKSRRKRPGLLQELREVPWNIILTAVVITAFLLSLWTLNHFKKRIETLEQKVALQSKVDHGAKAGSGSLSISKPTNGAMVLSNRIDIEGEA
ncbi:MAG: B-box zinc finger protein, partial [bacterium]